jgi:hypothetical protein
VVEFRPFEPDEMTLLNLIRAKTLEDGALAPRLPKAPSEPRQLSEQQRLEIHSRLKIGEPEERIANAYGIDVSVIRRLAR